MGRCPTLFALVTLAIAGCGGSGTHGSSGLHASSRNAGPADIPAMRALLERYSQNGTWIVRADDDIPREFKFGASTFTLNNSGNFASYFDDNAPENVVDYMSTAVHEVYHAVSFRLGYQLLAQANATERVESEGFYVGGSPQLVRYSAVFPAREMNATFPADAHSTRYSIYVSPSNEAQSTQHDGVFALLDEWTAYLHDGRTILDFWPWVRDEAPRTRDVYVKYRSRFIEIWVPHAEFQLFILHYLVHAKLQRPEVYAALMSNESFRKAFVAADAAWTELLAAATALEPSVNALAPERGAGGTTFYRDETHAAVVAHLAAEPYASLLAELRGR